MKKIGFGIVCVLLTIVALVLYGYSCYCLYSYLELKYVKPLVFFSYVLGLPVLIAGVCFFSEEVYPKFQKFNENRIKAKLNKLKETR